MGFTDNALFTMIQMLNFLSLKKMPLSNLICPLQTYYATGEINIQVKDKETVFATLEAHYTDAQQDHLDGLTIAYDTWWFNLRASNTEPLIRLNLEADDSTTEDERKQEVLNIIGEVDSSIEAKS
jgi:phosphomannomutase